MQGRVLVALTGGIAAYKVCHVVSALAKAGVEVQTILTNSAQQFITPLTLATLSRRQAFTDADFWQPTHGRPLHIELAEWADLLVIAPLSANTLAKLVHGMADNLLTNVVLASNCPVLVAPAMNTIMWEQATVQANWQKLLQHGRYVAIAPGSGVLACDAVGMGRMAEPEAILSGIESILLSKGKQDLKGKRVLISAGGTREFLDPVRFIGNPSTGKQGIALAIAASFRGAAVTLVFAGSANQLENLNNLNSAIQVIRVDSSAQMHEAMLANFAQADITIMAAAVGDVRPASYSDRKIPKAELPDQLPLSPIPDIVADLAAHKRDDQLLVGFAAQTGTQAEVIAAAKSKLERKKLNAIAANAIDSLQTGFGTDTNQATFISDTGEQITTPLCSKLELANRLLDFLLSFPN
jgi:phosphopantothenoylcysteine decarboxylase/phosphopantothenate--cysteine ligase